MATEQRKRAYHHGNLPAALVDATLELIAENGLQNFSVAEAARRTGVSISAPYRHFADRDELLAACAVAAYGELKQRFAEAVADRRAPEDRLAAASAAFLRFAAERQPMFDVLIGAGLTKAKYPQLATAAADALEPVLAAAAELQPDSDGEQTAALLLAINALAQGHATLLLDGTLGDLPAAVEPACTRVEAATRALIDGRAALYG